jgi:outer membrane protein with beta-barrel domain
MKTLLSAAASLAIIVGAVGALAPAASADERNVIDQYGLTLAVGGGVGGFVDGTMRDMTGVAGQWEARAAFGTKFPVAIEAGYIGGAQSIDALGLDTSAILLSTGFDATIRIQPIQGDIVPYVFAGAGWRRFSVTNANTNTSDVKDRDDVAEFPMGLGVAYRTGHLLLDVRGTFRLVASSDLVPSASGSTNLHNWGASLRAGWEF